MWEFQKEEFLYNLYTTLFLEEFKKKDILALLCKWKCAL